ncbi:MAG TPA: lysophospholipid acyltransferase family protein [Thermoanaerobaculia bacterium]|nr:lysophospholipid acyltransferase family protein [Thermoanaerobaculia bacterium]
MRTWLDRLLGAVARLVLGIFFREVEVRGLDRLPLGRPMVLVSNHVNGLIDPLLILGPLPFIPRFLAKSTLWKNPVTLPWVKLAGAIPVYRRQDEGADTSKNAEMFAQTYELLARGGALALFPEGKSHNEPALQPLKTGAARIVLEAHARFGDLGTRIVPVGLIFDAREHFRSRALVQVGEPVDPTPEMSLYKEDGPEAVRALTRRVDQALKQVTLNFPSWEEARLISRAADLYARPRLDLPEGRRMAESFAFHRAFVEGYQEMKERFPDKVETVAGCVREYDALLRKHRLRDAQIAAAYPSLPALRFVGRTLLRLVFPLPLAVIGTVLNWPPYRLVGEVVRRVVRTGDQQATYKLFGALFLFPLFWLLEAWLAGRWLGPGAAIVTFLAGPVTALATLRFYERARQFLREARAYLLLRFRKELAAELRGRREELFRQVEEVAELYEEGLGVVVAED